MTITEEYTARFNKLTDQMQQHVEMWIPDEQINLVDSFKTSIIMYSFLSSFIFVFSTIFYSFHLFFLC